MGNYSFNKVDKETGEVTGTMSLEVRAYPIAEPKGVTKGYASVTIDGMFGAHGISIVEGKNGLFASMPQTKDAKGEYRDIFHPVAAGLREQLNAAVLTEYGGALDDLAMKQESTLAKIRETSAALKDRPAADTPEKHKSKAAHKSADER